MYRYKCVLALLLSISFYNHAFFRGGPPWDADGYGLGPAYAYPPAPRTLVEAVRDRDADEVNTLAKLATAEQKTEALLLAIKLAGHRDHELACIKALLQNRVHPFAKIRVASKVTSGFETAMENNKILIVALFLLMTKFGPEGAGFFSSLLSQALDQKSIHSVLLILLRAYQTEQQALPLLCYLRYSPEDSSLRELYNCSPARLALIKHLDVLPISKLISSLAQTAAVQNASIHFKRRLPLFDKHYLSATHGALQVLGKDVNERMKTCPHEQKMVVRYLIDKTPEELLDVMAPRLCDQCKNLTAGGFTRCGHCKDAYYCNEACHRAAWDLHKARCDCKNRSALESGPSILVETLVLEDEMEQSQETSDEEENGEEAGSEESADLAI